MITVRKVYEKKPHEREGSIIFIADGPPGHEALLARTTPEAAERDGLAYFKSTRVDDGAGGWKLRTKPYDVHPARYAKGQNLVRPVNSDGIKDRAERLLCALNCRYTNRERGFVVSPSKLKRFEQLFADGWDACFFTRELQRPEVKS